MITGQIRKLPARRETKHGKPETTPCSHTRRTSHDVSVHQRLYYLGIEHYYRTHKLPDIVAGCRVQRRTVGLPGMLGDLRVVSRQHFGLLTVSFFRRKQLQSGICPSQTSGYVPLTANLKHNNCVSPNRSRHKGIICTRRIGQPTTMHTSGHMCSCEWRHLPPRRPSFPHVTTFDESIAERSPAFTDTNTVTKTGRNLKHGAREGIRSGVHKLGEYQVDTAAPW